MISRFTSLFFILIFVTAPVRAAPRSATDRTNIGEQIARLSDVDSAVRKQASDELAAMGMPARPQLLKAARSDDPEQRARAGELLKRLPWSVETDPPPVRGLMDRYGPSDNPTRVAIIRQLDRTVPGNRALLRLLREEPSESLRWIIVAFLWDTRDTAIQSAMREMEASADEPPIMVLAGRAWQERDPARALKLFRRAVEAEQSRPSDDAGVLSFAFDAVTRDALSAGRFDEAADYLRRQIPRDPMLRLTQRVIDNNGTPSLGRLMALHAYFGPLRGFDADVRAWSGTRAVKPTLTNTLVAFMSRLSVPPPLPCTPLELSGEDHYAAGEFLMSNKFPWAAEREYREALSSTRKKYAQHLDFFTLFDLANLVAERGDDAEAATLLERGMEISTPILLEMLGRENADVMAEIHWRRARAAQQRGNTGEANARVNDLLRLTPNNTDLTLSVIEWLKQTSRAEQAKTLFNKVYVQTRARLEATPEPNKAGMKNDLAWLCARSGEHVDEAVQLAQVAVDNSPDNAAFLDTLAEAQFRAGRRDDAVRTERRAIELSPQNPFMQDQLKRFESASPATSPSSSPVTSP